MKVLSVNEFRPITEEADSLCIIAEKYYDKLHSLKYRDKYVIEGKAFICISSDKNIIFRVEGLYKWFLKFSLYEEWVQREIEGAEAVVAMLRNFPGYKHPKAIRASIEQKYTLYSAVTGRSFNRKLLESCIFRLNHSPLSTAVAMESLGRTLGLLHSYDNPTGLVALNPTSVSYLRSYLGKINNTNSVIEKISERVAEWSDEKEHCSYIHGNIKSEDIFFINDQVCIIDFGTCGSGNSYEDLTNLCAYLMLFKAVPLFPWRIPRNAMDSLLSGYTSERSVNGKRLLDYVSLGIYRYYLKNIIMQNGVATLSGLPVRKKNIEHLVLQLLHNNYDDAFEGIHLQRNSVFS